MRYPSADTLETASRQGVGPHEDSGFLTLLFVPPGRPGLQVEHQRAVEGDRTSGRVPEPGRARISIPYFFNPYLSTRFPTLGLPEELKQYATGATPGRREPLVPNLW